MRTENRNRWMVLAIVVLALMNLSTLLTVIYHRKSPPLLETSDEQNSGISENSSLRFSSRYFMDELSLSSEQMYRFSEFNPEFRQSVRSINQQLGEKRKEMLLEMAGENCDTIRLNKMCDTIGYLHASLKKQTYLYYLNFKNICDINQQKKLEQLFGDIFSTDTQMGQFGKKGPNGNRRGRRLSY